MGEVIHSDVCGPFQVQGRERSNYYVTFIDDKSRFIAIYPIAKKNDVLAKFKEFAASLETEFGRKTIRQLVSDNGGEYTGKAFRDYCKSQGIKQLTTVPHTPEQNCIAEKANRTIVEGARAMMKESSTPGSLWPEAVVYAAYIRNRSPSRVLNDRSPYEIRFGKKPDLSQLKEFGAKVYYHIPKG